MNFFSKVIEIATGGFADKAIQVAEKWWPPEMSEHEKQVAKLEMLQLERAHELDLERAVNDAEKAFNERIKSLEGTASDLKSIPLIGPMIIFLRGVQRPLWGFNCLVLDWYWFTGWDELSEKQETALIVINFLVLGFLFGERAVRNLLPLFEKIWGKKGV